MIDKDAGSSPDRQRVPRGAERRRSVRYDTAIEILIRFSPDGTPITGWARDISANGIRVATQTPLAEASYVHISFANASNNTHCEGRVVWTQRNKEGTRFESGIDLARWGGDVNDKDVTKRVPSAGPKPDRRKHPR